MNRRRFLAGVGAALGASAGYGGVRIADYRPYDPALPSGETPRERIVAAAAHRFAADHRVVSEAAVRRDWTGEAPYDLGVHREWHEHSRRRHLHALTTFDAPLFESLTMDENPDAEYLSPHGDLSALLHYTRVFRAEDLPLTDVMHVTDGTVCFDFDAPTPTPTPPNTDVSADDVRVSGREGRSGVSVKHGDGDPMLHEYVRPHRATWERVGGDEETVTFRVTGADAYAQVVPLALTGVRRFVDPFVEVTLSRETGRLRRVLDHRDVLVDDWREGGGKWRRITYRIDTRFDRYGRASAPRPSGDVGAGVETWAKGVLSDLLTY